MKRKTLFALVLTFVAVNVLIQGVVWFMKSKNTEPNNVSNADATAAYVPARIPYENVEKLDQVSAFKEELYISNPKLPVPTNQWYSSVAFTRASEPIYAYPLAVKMNADGFGISHPSIQSTPNTIFASYNPDLTVLFPQKDMESRIETYDDLSVVVDQRTNSDSSVKLRITHGSPFVFASAAPNQTFTIVAEDWQLLDEKSDHIVFLARGKTYGLFFPEGKLKFDKRNERGMEVAVGPEQTKFSFAIFPSKESVDTFIPYAFNPITSTKVSFNVSRQIVKSRFEITTETGKETLLALLPKSYRYFDSTQQSVKPLGSYETVVGTQQIYAGSKFTFLRKLDTLPSELPVWSFSPENKDKLRLLVREDVKNFNITETDTYFLGKKLFAGANLLNLAQQLEMRDESGILRSKLRAELEIWKNNTLDRNRKGDKKYFVYDPVVKGIVGQQASFGSEFFNDHHFHYGYFIYAASILARYDEDYLTLNQNFINLLVKDIANTDRSDKNFPYLRGFDPYVGHSWASGQALFADGNNQESSSEAVNAWYGVFLWSGVTKDDNLKKAALYLYSEESASALSNWLSVNRSDKRFSDFQHPFVSMVWGGKLDFATWFSPKPEAKLGIIVLPLSSGSMYLGKNKENVRQHIESSPEFTNPSMFKDYLSMYQGFYNVASARLTAQQIQNADFDSANSKSYMEAWFLALERGSR